MTEAKSLQGRNVRNFCAAVLVGTALTACGEKREVRPVFNPSTNEIEFIFGTVTGPEEVVPVEFLEVVTCNTDSTKAPTDSLIWRIESATKPNIVKLSRLTYGETPPGARETVAAQPMEPGCYWVRDSKARYRFQKYSGGMAGSGDLLATDPVFKPKK